MSTKVKLEALTTALPQKIDLFICSASFEPRSASVLSKIVPSSIRRVLIFADHEVTGESGVIMTDKMMGFVRDRSTYVPLRLRDPLDIADTMVKALEGIAPQSTIVIDITTFTHEALLILLRVVQIALPLGITLSVAYNGATEYAVGLGLEEKWLTKGVTEIRSVLGFPGQSQPTRSQHLIVLAGFELERAERIIDAYEPTLLSIGLGDPLESISTNHHDVNRWFHRKLTERYRSVKQFMFSCDNVFHTKDAILSQARLFPEYNVVVAPLNTKISTIGVALAAVESPSIQVCYAVPEQYNRENYSSASDTAYLFDFTMPPA